jgi:flagellar basal-body rod modification protein FlgD
LNTRKPGNKRAGDRKREKMAAMAGLLNHQMTAGQALTSAKASPMATSTSGTASSTSGSSSSSATISANDFLTLLVTEMQNQDPTADTDPNEYINQLVSVNSLEQLIDINQNLTTALAPSTPSSGSGTAATQATSALTAKGGATTTAHAAATHKATAAAATHSAASTAPASRVPAAISTFAKAHTPGQAPGNLSIPAANPAAQTVANALSGRSH